MSTAAGEGQPVRLMRQHRPERRVMPGGACNEVLQLVVPQEPQPRRHRLQALALPRAKQPSQVERRPAPPRLAAHDFEEGDKPSVQIARPTNSICHDHPLPRSCPNRSVDHVASASAQVVLAFASSEVFR